MASLGLGMGTGAGAGAAATRVVKDRRRAVRRAGNFILAVVRAV